MPAAKSTAAAAFSGNLTVHDKKCLGCPNITPSPVEAGEGRGGVDKF
ncbi:hypothetical protein LNQ82_08260 [Conchiformibius steedae DSM 2580]|uniref:Uncharacterized protein n=1 Tax=Conchiformibius steedae DSM 2580 TaxID=1121352 RepID=A0AAE9HV46_9NEIS|nr:hypothetical protein [Conchiformibius steedae]QMT34394.1 hypothetical protein H3L98_05355 [Conchiformibius steedae]URD67173.1 hypothetical protein LNQ82_08260 [Conchiformibius steedae DSM 2580]